MSRTNKFVHNTIVYRGIDTKHMLTETSLCFLYLHPLKLRSIASRAMLTCATLNSYLEENDKELIFTNDT